MKLPSLVSLGMLVATFSAAAEPDKLSFNQHVRPILANVCFQCHGPDDKKRDGDLRLDVRADAIADRGGYAAITPGKPDASAIWERINSTDPDTVMPPPKAKRPKLTPEQLATIKRWIEEGAEYEGHWAFMPLAETPPPVVAARKWPRNAIDAYIAEKLEQKKLPPSAEADRATLIRRATLDLTGLLPSPEEVAAFASDASPDAYERLIDKLLADPAYGERWGRHWLDQARYADSHGYSIDGERNQWPYRDWVLQALNADQPFDQFTIEQLAGDLLPNATKKKLVATAFHRNTLINQEGGVDNEQFRNEATVDRVNTTGAVWLGLTIGCAQCHTHKYDPIPHREYYSLFAFFNNAADVNNAGPTVRVARGEILGTAPPPPTKADYEGQLATLQAEWEKAERAKRTTPVEAPQAETKWAAVKLEDYTTESNASFQLLDDQSLLTDGRGSPNDTYRVTFTTDLPKVAALRLRVRTHDSLPKKGPGTADNGNFVLTGFEVEVDGAAQTIRTAYADHEQPGYPVSAAIDEKGNSGWAINIGKGQQAKMNADHEAVFVFEKPIASAGKTLIVRMKHGANQRYLIGRFDLAVTAEAPGAKSADDEARAFAVALTFEGNKRSPEQAKLIREVLLRESEAARKLNDLAAKEREKDKGNAELMIYRDKPGGRETFVLQRGDFLRPDKKVGQLSPNVLSAVQAGFEQPPQSFANRLDLAGWLVHPQNPLTPRVTMNRMWMRLFGRGLVETEEDFGTQGTPPSHPALLDYLGREFIREGWSQKTLLRRITTSAVYRQSSNFREDAVTADPLNLLLARQARLRVEGEIVRDAALSAAGLLTREIGGPSVHPPQPSGVYAFTQNQKNWKTPAGAERYRRGLYTFFYRSAPYPLLTTFDAPDFQTVCTKRVRSNTPLQSLTVANDAAFLEIARGLAARSAAEVAAADVDARLQRLFQLTLQRPATERESAVLRKFYDARQAAYSGAVKDAAEFAPQAAGESLPAADFAALTSAARALLNTDAFITRE